MIGINKPKEFRIADILNEEEFVEVVTICREVDNYDRAKQVCEKVILPKIEVINKKTGQENDPMYISYAVIYAITVTMKQEIEDEIKKH